MKILPNSFFNRETTGVARELIGKSVVCRCGRATRELIITETESYDGPRDKASHAAKGKTPRNAVMFGPAGRWYFYFIYGNHWMMNITTREKNYPAAILIRAGITPEGKIVSGPGRLTAYLGIGKKIAQRANGRNSGSHIGIWIADSGRAPRRGRIKKSPRIGVAYAGAAARWPRRFHIPKPFLDNRSLWYYKEN